MKAPEEDEITDIEDRACWMKMMSARIVKAGDFEYTGETVDRYETEVEVTVKKVKHVYYVYLCKVCGQRVICRTPRKKNKKQIRSKCTGINTVTVKRNELINE